MNRFGEYEEKDFLAVLDDDEGENESGMDRDLEELVEMLGE